MFNHVIAFALMSLATLLFAQIHPWAPAVLLVFGVMACALCANKLTPYDTVSWRYRQLPFSLYLITAGIITMPYDGNGWLRTFATPGLMVTALVIQQTGTIASDQFKLKEYLGVLAAISCPAFVLWYTQVAGYTGVELWLAAVSYMALAMFLGAIIAPKRFIREPRPRHIVDVTT